VDVGELQRSLCRKAAQEPGHRFGDLFNLTFHSEWLRLAHDRVAENAGSKTAGCDGVVMADFDADLEGNLRGLGDSLKSGSFEARPVRRVYIPKANGRRRPLGIPSVRDRIVQEAVRMILEPIFEADFLQDSYGFRPNRRTMDAVKHLWPYLQRGSHWVIEGDISSYFDTIHHRKLMKLLARRIADGRLLDLVWQFLRAGVMERGLFKKTDLGTPQGGVVSPLLANVYLHELDRHLEPLLRFDRVERARRRRNGLPNFAYARYADDFDILCNGTKDQAYEMREAVHRFLSAELRLTLSLEKTKVTHLRDGFDFLGFHLRWQRTSRGKAAMVSVSSKAAAQHLETIRVLTAPSSTEDAFAAKTIALNRVIEGWCRYFQFAHLAGRTFHRLTHETYWLYARWLATKYKLSYPQVMRRFKVAGTLGVPGLVLTPHSRFKRLKYRESPHKLNPYLTGGRIEREELLDTAPWTGADDRPGRMDLRLAILQRDCHRCQKCGKAVRPAEAEVDHKRPYSCFKRHEDADAAANLWTLCVPCHAEKTESDR
jgi:group II intron reverse transcriptase/maturase